MLEDVLDLKVEDFRSRTNLPTVYKHLRCLALDGKNCDFFVDCSVAFLKQFYVVFTRNRNKVGPTLNNIS